MIYNKKTTPSNIIHLENDEILVFGTNPSGSHIPKIAAKYGAVTGNEEGLQGQTYAIPVHKHRRYMMVSSVRRFIAFSKENPHLKFYVIPVGCGAAGMDSSFVALMFREAVALSNVFLPDAFVCELNKYYEIGVKISDDCTTIVSFPRHSDMKYNVPRGIENIGESAFMACSCDLVLPDTLKRIEKWAFADMGHYEYYLRIPSSVNFIDDAAFVGEYVAPGMLVDYNSYAYWFAKKHKCRYKCVDFDENAHEQRQKELSTQHNATCFGLHRYLKEINGLSPVPKGQIGIARDFAFVLNDNGHLSLLGHCDYFKQLNAAGPIVKVAAAFCGYMALTERGNIVTGGTARGFERCRQIESLRGIIDVVACEGHTVALHHNGHVECIDEPGYEVPAHHKIVKEWQNIKQIAVGFGNIMALTHAGTVLYHSVDGGTNTHFYDHLSDIVQVDCYSHYYGNDYSAVLHRDGTVSSESFEGVNSWRDIIQISVGADVIAGLKRDGTLEMIDLRSNKRYVAKKWRNLASVECKFFQIVGITKSGEILAFSL